jgi:hypothetical protein
MVQLQIWDTPPNFDIEQLDAPLDSFATIVFVIDIQVSRRDGSAHTVSCTFS